jgi:hypothetical protein
MHEYTEKCSRDMVFLLEISHNNPIGLTYRMAPLVEVTGASAFDPGTGHRHAETRPVPLQLTRHTRTALAAADINPCTPLVVLNQPAYTADTKSHACNIRNESSLGK